MSFFVLHLRFHFGIASRWRLIYITDYGLEQIYEELGKPDIFLLDTAPIFRVLVICSPMIAEQISKPSSQYPYSMPKSWTVMDIMPLVGKQSIVTSDVRIDIMLDEIMLDVMLIVFLGRGLENKKEAVSTW